MAGGSSSSSSAISSPAPAGTGFYSPAPAGTGLYSPAQGNANQVGGGVAVDAGKTAIGSSVSGGQLTMKAPPPTPKPLFTPAQSIQQAQQQQQTGVYNQQNIMYRPSPMMPLNPLQNVQVQITSFTGNPLTAGLGATGTPIYLSQTKSGYVIDAQSTKLFGSGPREQVTGEVKQAEITETVLFGGLDEGKTATYEKTKTENAIKYAAEAKAKYEKEVADIVEGYKERGISVTPYTMQDTYGQTHTLFGNQQRDYSSIPKTNIERSAEKANAIFSPLQPRLETLIAGAPQAMIQVLIPYKTSILTYPNRELTEDLISGVGSKSVITRFGAETAVEAGKSVFRSSQMVADVGDAKAYDKNSYYSKMVNEQTQGMAWETFITAISFAAFEGGGKAIPILAKNIETVGFKAAVGKSIYQGIFENAGKEIAQKEFTAASTGILQPSVKMVAKKEMDAFGVIERTDKLYMSTKNTPEGIKIEFITKNADRVSQREIALIPKDYINLPSTDPGYLRSVSNLKNTEAQFTYARATTSPFEIQISSPFSGRFKPDWVLQGNAYETQIASSTKLLPFERSIKTDKGGVEPIGKSNVISIKEYYIDGQRVGARTNVDVYYTGLANEIKTPLGKGYELPTYRKTSGGTFELLPEGQGKIVTGQPTAEFAGNIIIEGKSPATTFAKSGPGEMRVSGKYVGEGNVEVSVNKNSFLYPERIALSEKGTRGGFRVVGYLGKTPMDSLALTSGAPTPKVTPRNVGKIATISFKEAVINPKKSMESLGARVYTPIERPKNVFEMGGLSVKQPTVVSEMLQEQKPAQIFKEAPTKEGNVFSVLQAPGKMAQLPKSDMGMKLNFAPTTKMANLESVYQDSGQVSVFTPTTGTKGPTSVFETVYQPRNQIFKVFQTGAQTEKVLTKQREGPTAPFDDFQPRKYIPPIEPPFTPERGEPGGGIIIPPLSPIFGGGPGASWKVGGRKKVKARLKDTLGALEFEMKGGLF